MDRVENERGLHRAASVLSIGKRVEAVFFIKQEYPRLYNHPRMKYIAALLCALTLWGCHSKPTDLSTITEEFVYSLLALSPASATQAGYHSHKGVALDSQLDDLSPAGIEAQRKFLKETREKLAGIDPQRLNPE